MIVRTKLVELSTLPAVAYRQKLFNGSGVVILRYGNPQPGLASISRSTGESVAAAHTNLEDYPVEAFREALELTAGLPYSRRGKVQVIELPPENSPSTEQEESLGDHANLLDSAEYQAIVEAYTNAKGELSYGLMNKDFIQFARSSKVVSEMLSSNASLNELRDHVIKAKFETLTGNTRLTSSQIGFISDLLDEVSPKSVFRDFEDDLRKMLAEAKKGSL